MKKWFTAIWRDGDIEEIEQPHDLYYADPFIVDGFLFVEQYDQKKGVIACRPIGGGEWKVVLEEPYHLSFPCVVKDGGDYYMVPESGINHTVDLYKATKFPYEWKKERMLLEGKNWADPILHFENGAWYLFATSEDNFLEIYKSDSLDGEFQRIHADNHMHSRSAGKIFRLGAKRIRPVQNGTPTYGTGIIFKQITIQPYSETIVGEIKADWAEGLVGTHTINAEKGIVVIDGKRETPLDSN